MNRLLKKRILIISISLALLLLINIGVSYSYYLGKVVGNESVTTLSFKSAGIIITYENNSGNIEASNIMPGWSATKNFSLSSNILETDFTNDQTKLWYEIILYIDQNDFPFNLITYSLNSNETIVGNGQVADAKTNIAIETGTNENGISLGLGYFTVGSNKHDYSVTFNYVDYGSKYGNYPDNIFSVHIGAKVVTSSVLNIDLGGGSIDGTTTKYISKGGIINLPIPTKDGFDFLGWKITSGDGIVDGNNITVTSEVLNISAVWKINVLSSVLVIDLDGGTSTQETIVNINVGEIYNLVVPEKANYIFSSWKIISGDADISNNKIVPQSESVKIVALWESVIPNFTYTGTYTLINDSVNNWRIKFLTSGTLEFITLGNATNGIDVFLVGGGGSGGSDVANVGYGAGGGGGYTKTIFNITPYKTVPYTIVIGDGGKKSNGGESSAFGESVDGGKVGGNASTGGNGGSGGGGAGIYRGGAGGTDGSNGSAGDKAGGGAGQGTTTREFGEADAKLYSNGGGGYGNQNSTAFPAGDDNTGNGGGGLSYPGASGIVIIRNHR